jgi:hypothetical protein
MYELYNQTKEKPKSSEGAAQAASARFLNLVMEGFEGCIGQASYATELVGCFERMPEHVQFAYNNMMNMVDFGSCPRYISLYIAHDMLFRNYAEEARTQGKKYLTDVQQNILCGICTQLEREMSSHAHNYGILALHMKKPWYV